MQTLIEEQEKELLQEHRLRRGQDPQLISGWLAEPEEEEEAVQVGPLQVQMQRK